MLTLALDTALSHCQAAVIRLPDGEVIAEASEPAAGDAEAIVARMDDALAAAGASPKDLARIAVTVGPGSFTGVRVGIACARGLAFALGIPAAGVSTLEVMARQVDAPCVTLVDARHGAVFAALWPDASFRPAVMARMTVAEACALAGDGAVRVAGDAGAVAALGAGIVVERLDPVALALAGAAEGATVPPRALYLAPVDAAPQRHKALARA